MRAYFVSAKIVSGQSLIVLLRHMHKVIVVSHVILGYTISIIIYHVSKINGNSSQNQSAWLAIVG